MCKFTCIFAGLLFKKTFLSLLRFKASPYFLALLFSRATSSEYSKVKRALNGKEVDEDEKEEGKETGQSFRVSLSFFPSLIWTVGFGLEEKGGQKAYKGQGKAHH